MADYTTEQRKQMAADGEALPDGSYPIKTRQDLANAILSIGRATNPMTVKAWIIKRAKALGATSMLPKSWGV